jgi:site-specific DNA-adenine methylase
MSELLPPVAYQGSKARIADKIVDAIGVSFTSDFYDVCCGNGSVSIEMVRRGLDPCRITMLDAGPWGLFWQKIGDGSFDHDQFASYCRAIPADLAQVKSHMEALSKGPVGDDAVYVYLLLQAASFGGKAIWNKDGRWVDSGFRSYWLPTETSIRRSPVNPMMPMCETLMQRVRVIGDRMAGVRGICMDAMEFRPGVGTIYVDPPYTGTTGYGHTLDVMKLVRLYNQPCFVSEGRSLSPSATCIATGRTKGGISGERAVANQEWLSYFPCDMAVAA